MSHLLSGHLLKGGEYTIIKTLGQGGFGITYLAEKSLLGKKFCIKEFFIKDYCDRDDQTSKVSLGTRGNAEMMQKYRAKFMKEARLIAQLDHPNIIRISDVFEENNTAYFVTDYIEGDNLNDIVKKNGALPESKAIDYIRQVGKGLSYVHKKGINHLDIKPGNIMVKDDGDIAILIDFGMSKRYDESGEQTSSTPVGVSAGYAPLEMYRSGGVSSFSPETDVYELGATLYRLVTGNVPPQASDIFDEGLPSLPDTISVRTKDAIQRAMEMKKKDRPSSVEEFLSMLPEDYADDEIATRIIDTDSTNLVPDATKIQEELVIEEGTMAVKLISYSGSIIDVISVLTNKVGVNEDTVLSNLKSLPWTLIEGISSKTATQILSMLEKCGAKVDVFDKVEEENKNVVEDRKPKELDAELKRLQDSQMSTQFSINEPKKKGSLKKIVYGAIAAIFVGLAILPLMNRNNASENIFTPEIADSTGDEYVDLGLPSGLKWAICNLGASKPEEYGDYYSWGETSLKDVYSEENYSYKDNPQVLPLSADVSHLKLGSKWRIPTIEDVNELRAECKWLWTKVNGVNGYKVVGPNGNSIFLPAAGYRGDKEFYNVGSHGGYWISSLYPNLISSAAWYLLFDSHDVYGSYYYRYFGQSIRPVLD